MTLAVTMITFDTHWYDVVVVIMLIIGLWSGMRTGLSSELLRMAGIVMGVIAGMRYYTEAGEWLTRHFALVPERANLLMFVAIVLAVYLIFGFARSAVSRWTRNRPLPSSIEGLGGAAAGMVRMGAVMVSVSVYFCLLQSEFWHEQIGRESQFGQYVVEHFPDLAPIVQRHEVEKIWFLRELKRRPEPGIEQIEPEGPQKPSSDTTQKR